MSLTEQEAQELCSKFEEVDANKDGVLEVAEIDAVLKEMFRSVDEEVRIKLRDTIIAAADKNGDNKVDLNEFLSLVREKNLNSLQQFTFEKFEEAVTQQKKEEEPKQEEPSQNDSVNQSPKRELNEDIEAELRECEDEIYDKSRDMGRLRGEYALNLRKLQDSFFPKAYPYMNAVHMNRYYQKHLEVEIDWMEKKVIAMEQHKAGFFELRDMAAHKKELFDSLTPIFEESFLEMSNVTKQELAVLRGYDNPPQIVLDTIETVMIVRNDEDRTWEASRVMLSETYFYSFFVNKCRHRMKEELTVEQADALERYLLNPESVPESVARASVPCGAMAKWLHALSLFYQYQRITEVTKTPLDQLKDDLMALRLKLQDKKEDIRGAEQKLTELTKELSEREEELRKRYDMTMLPLQDLFFDAHNRFNDTFCSPRRRMEEGQSPYRN